jgi:serine/threonine protein phosphatase PrpC
MTDICRLTWRTFHAPKAGHGPDEYEDAFAGDLHEGRFAIADGASESAFADVWAKLVVNAYVNSPGPWSAWLTAAREQWCVQVQERELPWYAEAKFQEGAYAAVLGIAFKGSRWRATAVGDCCLFHVRDQHLLQAFPLRHSREFSNRPSLVGSRRRKTEQARARRIHVGGKLLTGDVLFLTTDALAEYFLKQFEDNQKPWQDWLAFSTDELFAQRIQKLRAAKVLRNDDVTLMIIETPNP